MRKVNRETFKQKEFIKYTTVEEVVEELYMGK